jgi:hypothetical protein
MDTRKQPGFADYLQAAFLNQYNLIFSGGILIFGVMSGWIAIVLPIWLGLELVAMWKLSTNPGFQKRIDASWEQSAHLSQEKLLPQLPEHVRDRYLTLKASYEEIRRSAESTGDNLGVSVWQAEIDKLSYVLSSFLRLAHFHSNLELMLDRNDKQALRTNLNSVHKKMSNCSDNLKVQYQKYIEVLQTRLDKLEKAGEISEAIRVQLNIIEEQFKLIQQQIFLVKNPQELTDQLDFLVQGINEIEDQGSSILSLQAELAKLAPAPPSI